MLRIYGGENLWGRGAGECATAILSESAPVQERGTVSEYAGERTIRYYLSKGCFRLQMKNQGTASVSAIFNCCNYWS